MEKRVVIIEDNGIHFDLIKKGIEKSKVDFSIISIDLKSLIKGLKTNDEVLIFNTTPKNIDLFIIDVSLGKGKDELGLDFLLKLIDNYKYEFKYIVTSIWSKELFETKISIEDKLFINKNNFMGFEFTYEIRNKINKLWK